MLFRLTKKIKRKGNKVFSLYFIYPGRTQVINELHLKERVRLVSKFDIR